MAYRKRTLPWLALLAATLAVIGVLASVSKVPKSSFRVAIDAKRIYWSNWGDATLRAVAK